MRKLTGICGVVAMVWATLATSVAAQGPAKLPAYKQEVEKGVDEMAKLAQEMVDSVFSFGELGFQEVRDVALPDRAAGEVRLHGAARRGRHSDGVGREVGLGQAGDRARLRHRRHPAGVAEAGRGVSRSDHRRRAGHGEGHNTGMPLNIVAAIAVKRIMERDKLPGTIMLWPGVAEEQLATKAWYVRDGVFKDVDVVLFTHVGNNLGVSWGEGGGNGMVSVEYTFEGETAHSAGAPWRGRSALDAVELMSIGWQYRREHLRLSQRSHSVITNGGDQPNVVPRNASIWFYFRETDYANIKNMWDIGNKMAEGAALMTNTKMTSRILGAAYPQHMNKAVAEAMYENIKTVGLPSWSEDDQTLAKALQKELGNPRQEGLALKLGEPRQAESGAREYRRRLRRHRRRVVELSRP